MMKGISVRRTAYLIILFCLFCPPLVWGEPTITNAYISGEHIIISGADFGSHADYNINENYLCNRWEDLEDGSAQNSNPSNPPITIVDYNNRRGSSYSHLFRKLPTDTEEWIYSLNTSKTQYFLSYWMRLSDNWPTAPGGSCQFKLNVFWDSGWNFHIYPSITEGGTYHKQNSGGCTGVCSTWHGSFTQWFNAGEWHRHDVWVSIPDGGQPSEYKTWCDNTLMVDSDGCFCPGNLPYRCSIGGYMRTDGGDWYAQHDDVYISNTLARVEIGNNSNWPNCDHREIQIPTAWSGSSITVRVNQGSFQEGQTAYVFVVDADGNVNTNGYPVVIGAGGGEDNTAPTTSGHNPSKNATNVAPNTNVVVHVQDSGDGVDIDSLQFTVNSEQISKENLQITGDSSAYEVGYDPPIDFDYNSVITVSIDAQDLHDPANVMATDSYSFTVQSELDIVDPTVSITQPAEDTYSTAQNTITLSGTASDNVGVTSVTWENDREGSDTASGTTTWTISNISLQEGDNVITITAHDAAGNTNTDTLTVTYTPPPGTYTEEFGSATGADYPGTLEDTFINLNEENSFASEYLNTYTWPQDTVANVIIIKWDLSAIPSSATIQSVTLHLYLSDMQGGGGDDLYDLSVHKIINYNPVISECTGYTHDGTNSWTPNNQCYNDIPLAQADIATAEDTKSIDKTYGYKSWSVTNMVRDWVSNSASNYGMLVNSDPIASSNSNRYFSATESSNPDQRPKLVITYSVGPDTTPPADVTGFNATSGPGQITLTWTNPTDTDFAGVMIRYRTDGTNPQNKDDGSPIPNGNDGKIAGSPGQNMSYVHTNLDPTKHYHYSAFSYDTSNNYSQTAYADAQPLSPNNAPVIQSFTGVPSSLNNPGETTIFNVSATDPEGDSLAYTISFGDGTANGSGSEVVHTYAAQGTYTATATVNDGNGNTVAESLQVPVNDIPPAEPINVSAN